jgi:hypothetical protein
MNNTLDIKENEENSLFVILTCKLSSVMGMLAVSTANFVICFWHHIVKAPCFFSSDR